MAILELRDLSKFYNTSGTVALGLRHVNLSFSAGEFVAITGESGSGKTTLLNVLSGLDGYDEGELLICGKETSYCSERERETYRNNLISYIFQDYSIIDSYTVYQNVELALLNSIRDKKQRHEKVMEILRKVGLEDHAKHRGTKLSGGQKQRVSIARALAKDAPILFGDEPTGNLDSKTGKEIMELLNSLSKEKLVIIVTHNYEDLQEYATRRIRLFDGEIIEDKLLNEGELPLPVAERFLTMEKLASEGAERKIVEEYSQSVSFFSDAAAEINATETVDKKTERKRKFEETKHTLKTMLHIGGNNLKSTPKRTFFSFTGMVLLALAVIYACNSYFSASWSQETRQNNITYSTENRNIITVVKTDGYFTQAEIDAIQSEKDVTCVQNNTNSQYYLTSVDLSEYLEYKKGGFISFEEASSLSLNAYCAHNQSKVDEGRLPEKSGEIMLVIPSNAQKNELLGKTINLIDEAHYVYDPQKPEAYVNFYGTLPRADYVVVGVNYGARASAYFYHEDFVRIRSNYDSYYYDYGFYGYGYSETTAPEEAADDLEDANAVKANGSQNLSKVYVYFNSEKHTPQSVMSAIRDKGFKCYYPYGLQSQSMNMQIIISLLELFGIMIVLLIVLAVSAGAQRSVSDLKRREYGIMRTVGITGSMLGKMYLTEQWILAFFAHITSGVIFLLIQFLTLLSAKKSGVDITLLAVKSILDPFWKSFLLGFFITMLFAAFIVRRFNKKFYNNTVKSALTETEALV